MHYPLQNSQKLMMVQYVQEVMQIAYIAPSFLQGMAFFISYKVAQLIASSRPITPYLPILTTLSIYKAFGNNQNKLRKLNWIIPISMSAITAVIAYKCYMSTYSFFLKGVICGAHAWLMMLYSYDPLNMSWFGLPTLKGNFKELILNSARFKPLNQQKLSAIDLKAENIALMIFFISGITLTRFFQNPILANCIAYPLLPLTKIVSMRILSEIALHSLKTMNVTT